VRGRSRPLTLTARPRCELDGGRWACVPTARLRRSIEPGPPQRPWGAPPGLAVLDPRPRTATPRTHRPPRWHRQVPARTPLPPAKLSQQSHRRPA